VITGIDRVAKQITLDRNLQNTHKGGYPGSHTHSDTEHRGAALVKADEVDNVFDPIIDLGVKHADGEIAGLPVWMPDGFPPAR
jgi:hypothetical protein